MPIQEAPVPADAGPLETEALQRLHQAKKLRDEILANPILAKTGWPSVFDRTVRAVESMVQNCRDIDRKTAEQERRRKMSPWEKFWESLFGRKQ